MNERRRLLSATKKDLVLYTKRFYPSGTYYWTVPEGCTEVDVFLVGGGGSGTANVSNTRYGGGGAGGGYTKTYKSSTTGYRDGDAISVTPGESISIIVGEGASSSLSIGGYSQFKSSSYRAYGGEPPHETVNFYVGGNGGSGGGSDNVDEGSRQGGSDGSDGSIQYNGYGVGYGQGHTTRDFGESSGNRNAGGGGGKRSSDYPYAGGGASDYSKGSGTGLYPGGGYGGGGGFNGAGGDGTVLIRYYAYEQ